MRTVHIYKLSTYKYFFTTVLDNTSEANKEYEYVCDINVDDDDQQISVMIQKNSLRDENVDKITDEIMRIPLDQFDECREKFNSQMKTSLSTCSDVYFVENMHDVFSNVYNMRIVAKDCDINFALINSQSISTTDVKQYLLQQKPQIKTIEELDCAIDAFNESELDVYIVELPISTNPYQTMRRRGSCMTTINEYYIPSLNTSYNFYETTNILIGDTIEDRYVEKYWKDEKLVKFTKTQISGEELANTLSTLKNYTNFKLSTGKLFVREQIEENTQI